METLVGKAPIEHLYDYTRNSEECQGNPLCMESIQTLIRDEGETVKEDTEKIVFRGQRVSRIIEAHRHLWFSTSTSLEATETFREVSCCVFKIHLMPGVKYFDVNKEIVG